MSNRAKGAEVIREALGRAMYDCPRLLIANFREGYNNSTGMEIARRMVRELDHAGWRMKDGTRREVMGLEDAICLGLSMIDTVKLASDDPALNNPARVRAADAICKCLGYSKVTLVRKVSGASP